MSGLEVAGVVLGTLPLIISALEHYEKTVQTVRRYRQYVVHLQRLNDAVKTQEVIFRNNIERLLAGVVSADMVAVVMSTPAEHGDVDRQLKLVLGASYEVYLANLRGMEAALTQMSDKLALTANKKTQSQDPSLIRRELRKLRFSISKEAYDDQLRELREYNADLSRLIPTSQAPTLLWRGPSPNFKKLQSYAKVVDNLLRRSLQCGCQSHAVKLRLENRDRADLHSRNPREYCSFRVVFAATANNSAIPSTSAWKEAEIRCVENANQGASLVDTSQDNVAPAGKPKVRFSLMFGSKASKASKASKLPSPPTGQSANSQSPQLSQIQHLCGVISKLPSNEDECVGYLMDDHNQKHGIYTKSAAWTQQQWTTLTLQQILAGTASPASTLRMRDKLTMAVHLASGVLQLYNTPWLGRDWKENDVLLVHPNSFPKESMFENLFVQSVLSKNRPQKRNDTAKNIPRVVRNQTLYNLAVVLIELCYGKAIDKLERPEDLHHAGSLTVQWCTSDRLLKTDELDDLMGRRYAEAARRCFYCNFGVDRAGLDDEKFQQAVHSGVVEQLEASLRYWLGNA